MKLSDLLVDVAEVGHDLHIAGLTLDSRQVKEGDAFIALNGALQHGLQHAEQAVAGGSVVIIYDPEGITQWPKI